MITDHSIQESSNLLENKAANKKMKNKKCNLQINEWLRLLNSMSKKTNFDKSVLMAKKKEMPGNIYKNNGMKFNYHKHRIPFSENEDNQIKMLVEKNGRQNWNFIASFIPNRTPKQCRDRYCNYLAPHIFNGEWSKEEDNLLIKLIEENGPKWSLIKKYFPHRCSNSVKNRWIFFLCRQNTSTFHHENDDSKNINAIYENESAFIDEINNCSIGFENEWPVFE